MPKDPLKQKKKEVKKESKERKRAQKLQQLQALLADASQPLVPMQAAPVQVPSCSDPAR